MVYLNKFKAAMGHDQYATGKWLLRAELGEATHGDLGDRLETLKQMKEEELGNYSYPRLVHDLFWAWERRNPEISKHLRALDSAPVFTEPKLVALKAYLKRAKEESSNAHILGYFYKAWAIIHPEKAKEVDKLLKIDKIRGK